MKHGAVHPPRVGRDAQGLPISLDHRERYHPHDGAFTQAHEVFLAGNGLPARWQGRDDFVVLETGFGLGNNFLATWAAWQADPLRCERLVFISIERHPLSRVDLAAMHQGSPTPALAADLVAAWPPATPDLHGLSFEAGRVILKLALGEISAWLPALQATVDAYFLDGFDPDHHPDAWEPRAFQAMARLAAPGATAATWTTAASVRERLAGAGFSVRAVRRSGTDIGTGTDSIDPVEFMQARFEPRFEPKRPPARRTASPQAAAGRHALVLGAGLAGCASVAALAAQGWRTTLVDRGPGLATEASGNPAGLFHGIVHAGDGLHARFHRACALQAQRTIARLLADEGPKAPSQGAVDGLLRLETGLSLEAMQALLQQLGLPDDHVQALDAAQASARAGLPITSPAWFHHAGGWVRPRWLAQRWREAAGAQCTFMPHTEAAQLNADEQGWTLRDADHRVIARAPVLVLANGVDARRLLGPLGLPAQACPIEPVRGQIALLDRAGAGATQASHPWRAPNCPLVGSGYLLPAVDDRLVFGATSQPGDLDATVRDEDHRLNLERLAGLSPALAQAATLSVASLQGRTGWRCVSRDRLPLIGAVPEAWVGGPSGDWDQPRFVPRAGGLYLCTGLGSRGITVAALAAELLAATVTGAPSPLPADLVDAVDPARFLTRATRRRAAAAQGLTGPG